MAVGSARSNYDIFLEYFSQYTYISQRLNHSCGNSRRQEIHGRDIPSRFYGLSDGEHQAAGESPDGKAPQPRCQILVNNLATRLFMALPQDLRTMSSSSIQNSPNRTSPIQIHRTPSHPTGDPWTILEAGAI